MPRVPGEDGDLVGHMALEAGIDLLEDDLRHGADGVERRRHGRPRRRRAALARGGADAEDVGFLRQRGGHVAGPPRHDAAEAGAGQGHRAVERPGEIVGDNEDTHGQTAFAFAEAYR